MGGVNLLLGPMLVGVFFNCILYGVSAVQTLIYFQTYKRDTRCVKILVAYLMFCETVNTACDMYLIYEPLIVRYGTERAITEIPLMLPADALVTVLVSTPVQLFIAWRVKITSKSVIVPIIIALLSVAAFAGGIATSVSVSIVDEYADFHKFNGAEITWLASSAAADILITAALVHNLSRQRTGFAATDDLINRIIRLTIQTGMVTSVFATLDMILFVTTDDTTLNAVWDLPLSKLYSNTLLSTLNARGGWKATPSALSNVLFVEDSFDVENPGTPGRPTQIEFLTVDPFSVAGRPTSVVPLKGFDAEAGDPK